MLLVFAEGEDCSPDLKILAEIAADYGRFLDEQTQVLAIMQCPQEIAARLKEQANLPFPLLVDEDGEYIAQWALRTTTVTLPRQFILLIDSVRCSRCTERQKDS